MKTIIFSLLFTIISVNALGQSKDSVIYESETLLLVKKNSSKYKLTNKKTSDSYDSLKFVKRINSYFQILDNNNKVFYLAEDWEREDEVNDYFQVCGTVPHFTLTVKSNDNYFEILEDETFYDHNNETPAEIKFKIDGEKTSSVIFINGKTNFQFTSNFNVGIGITDPRMLIHIKDGLYFISDNPELTYDSIEFTNYQHSLKTMKNNLYGLLGVIEPQYKRIDKFNYYLAKAETIDGKVLYIDIEGNKYK